MTRKVEIAPLDMGWVEKFHERIEDTLDSLGWVASLMKMAVAVGRFITHGTEEEHATWDTPCTFVLAVQMDVPSGGVEINQETGKPEQPRSQHTLTIKKWVVPMAVMLQMLQPLMLHLFEVCKKVEADSALLQEVMGAVSALKDMAAIRVGVDTGEPDMGVN